ncbi:MAG: hypothetical protein IJR06_00620 [Paludibacteraceae bacterium]|nr:hypothetical protein [Paludibacteraceae bacterium]
MNSIVQFCQDILRKSRYGVTLDECMRALQTACDFCKIPVPETIYDLTNNPDGQTMFLNSNPDSYSDDIICYDLEQLKALGVNSYDGLTTIFVHENVHRLCQNKTIPGQMFGQWEGELVADYFMGVRAYLENLKIDSVIAGLAATRGSGSHPPGTLRKEYINYGKTEAYLHTLRHIPFGIEDYYKCFLKYRQDHIEDLRRAQLEIY